VPIRTGLWLCRTDTSFLRRTFATVAVAAAEEAVVVDDRGRRRPADGLLFCMAPLAEGIKGGPLTSR